jgi:hypothetical protein
MMVHIGLRISGSCFVLVFTDVRIRYTMKEFRHSNVKPGSGFAHKCRHELHIIYNHNLHYPLQVFDTYTFNMDLEFNIHSTCVGIPDSTT